MVMNHQMLYFSVILNHLKPVVTCDSYMPWKQKVKNLSSILLNNSNNLQRPHACDTTCEESFTFSDTNLNDTKVNSCRMETIYHVIGVGILLHVEKV